MLNVNQSSIVDKEDVLLHLRCRQQINSYKALHQRALMRIEAQEEKQKAAIEKLNASHALEIDKYKKSIEKVTAENKKLKKKIFGTSSEVSKGKNDSCDTPSGKPKGQQLGSKGHGRTARPPSLSIIEEIKEIPLEERTCLKCQSSYPEILDAEESQIYEIEVKGYTRKVIRKKYKTCNCNGKSRIITAPLAHRLLPKTKFGVSIWFKFIANKFILGMPIERTCKELQSYFGPIAPGTIVGGFKMISPLFDPLMTLFHERLMQANYFHCDETFWKVFEKIAGKNSYQWYIWGVFSEEVRYYHFSPFRNTNSLFTVFKGLNETLREIVIVADRYTVYKCYAKQLERIILAFCWAHVRRDFLSVGNSFPEHLDWALSWREAIGELYAINKKRVKEWKKEKTIAQQSIAFRLLDKQLFDAIIKMKKKMLVELADEMLHESKRKVLESLKNHWHGLTKFLKRPFIRMDNNTAERELRGLAVGRKNYYGSGAKWSAEFTGKIYSFFKTYELWKLDSAKVLYSFLLACSENGGKPPEDLTNFLPWEMSEERKTYFREPISQTQTKNNILETQFSSS